MSVDGLFDRDVSDILTKLGVFAFFQPNKKPLENGVNGPIFEASSIKKVLV